MGAFTLAVVKVLGLNELDSGISPLLGKRISIIDVHVDGSAPQARRIDAGSSEMDRQFVTVRERVPLVVMRSGEAQLHEMGNGTRYIRDHEDRLDADNAWHT
jgi:hypothetical protein